MSRTVIGFRPQQGLLIMNGIKKVLSKNDSKGFRPQQGLTIMNKISEETARIEHLRNGFRPQQGLPIMNLLSNESEKNFQIRVSVPNRGYLL